MGVLDGSLIVGHLPKEISSVCHYFIKRGGVIQVEVTDSNYRRSQIREGGLEIPALLIFLAWKRTFRSYQCCSQSQITKILVSESISFRPRGSSTIC